MLIAADRRQARVVYRYISGLLHATPMLEGLVANETKEAIELTNRITIEIHAASYRSIRGYTVVAAICDEIAFWRTDDSANPDTEILYALRPTMATVPGGLMLCISSPYARRGELYRAYRDHYGRASDVLVWQADTRTMNPTVPETFITEAYPQDAAVAAAEYGAEFRRDIESFVSREAVEACVVPDRRALPPVSGTTYRAFTGLWTYDRADDGARTTAQQEVRIRPHVALESLPPAGDPGRTGGGGRRALAGRVRETPRPWSWTGLGSVAVAASHPPARVVPRLPPGRARSRSGRSTASSTGPASRSAVWSERCLCWGRRRWCAAREGEPPPPGRCQPQHDDAPDGPSYAV